ncbi:GhoT/OrtT family toxin, partial [Escherichia coli]|uniref:GhoT/OrtT family toxin n=1 Tax=Escherichia coli TaxID=562 RepID=UPI003F50585C
MSQHHVNPALIHRTAWGNPLWNALHNLNITGLCLAGSIITALIWPLALPVCLLFTL